MSRFFAATLSTEKLDPRWAFFGGRTSACYLYLLVNQLAGDRIYYFDVSFSPSLTTASSTVLYSPLPSISDSFAVPLYLQGLPHADGVC